MNAAMLLSAIEAGELAAIGIDGRISILINGLSIASIRCGSDTPRACVAFDGISVDVFASLDAVDTISIRCESPQDAGRISKALEVCFESAYRDVLDQRA